MLCVCIHVLLFIAGSRVSNVRATENNGIEWTAPSHVPTTCFPQYIVNASNSSFTVNGTMVSFEELEEVDFTFCETVPIVVTPVEGINRMPVDSSSSIAMTIYVSDGILHIIFKDLFIGESCLFLR